MIEVAGRRPFVDPVRVTPDYGKFVIEPLPHGYGTTLGNALRRALLSSVPGVAVTSARIEGAAHEFTTLEGVLEDLTELILNLKELAFSLTGAAVPTAGGLDRWPARIEAEGVGEVTGADVELSPELRVVNPELHLATLTSETARLAIDLTIETGVGYVAADRHDVTQMGLGQIPIDSLFTPVQRVNHVVESTRVGHQTDLDRLVIEVWTNAAMSPVDALSTGARVLDGYVRLFFDFSSEPRLEPREGVGLAVAEGPRSELLDSKIEELDFSVRTYNCLKKENINTIGELVQLKEKDLLEIRNLGTKSLSEIREKLTERGLQLTEEEE